MITLKKQIINELLDLTLTVVGMLMLSYGVMKMSLPLNLLITVPGLLMMRWAARIGYTKTSDWRRGIQLWAEKAYKLHWLKNNKDNWQDETEVEASILSHVKYPDLAAKDL
jgi:hypothetical protein